MFAVKANQRTWGCSFSPYVCSKSNPKDLGVFFLRLALFVWKKTKGVPKNKRDPLCSQVEFSPGGSENTVELASTPAGGQEVL